MKAYQTTKKCKKLEVHQLIRALGKREEKRRGEGEAEQRERRNDSTVDFTV